MKSFNINSSLIRSCYIAFLAIAFVFASQVSTFGQTKAELKAEFQKALDFLPDARTTKRLSPASQKLVNDARSTYQQGLNIENMSPSQESSFMSQLNANHTTVTSTATEPSCTQRCWNERNTCLANSGCTDTTWPCWCCIPCNLNWELCVIDCLVNIEIGIKLGGAVQQQTNH